PCPLHPRRTRRRTHRAWAKSGSRLARSGGDGSSVRRPGHHLEGFRVSCMRQIGNSNGRTAVSLPSPAIPSSENPRSREQSGVRESEREANTKSTLGV
ncbi:hypothetical protein RTBOTA2_002928, partial [Rhodotorula toruloides]